MRCRPRWKCKELRVGDQRRLADMESARFLDQSIGMLRPRTTGSLREDVEELATITTTMSRRPCESRVPGVGSRSVRIFAGRMTGSSSVGMRSHQVRKPFRADRSPRPFTVQSRPGIACADERAGQHVARIMLPPRNIRDIRPGRREQHESPRPTIVD